MNRTLPHLSQSSKTNRTRFLLSAYTDTNYDGTGYDLQGNYAQCYNIPAFLQNDIKSLQLNEGTKKCVLYAEKACAGKKKTFSKDSKKVTFKPLASLYCYTNSDSSATSSDDGGAE